MKQQDEPHRTAVMKTFKVFLFGDQVRRHRKMRKALFTTYTRFPGLPWIEASVAETRQGNERILMLYSTVDFRDASVNETVWSDFSSATHRVHLLKLHHWGGVQSVENNVIFIHVKQFKEGKTMVYHSSHLAHWDQWTICADASFAQILSNIPAFPATRCLSVSSWRLMWKCKYKPLSMRVWQHHF